MTFRRANTLLEFLTVIGVIGVLIGLLLPAVQSTRDASSRAACQHHLRQIGLAAHSFHSTHQRFPRQGMGVVSKGQSATPEDVLNWLVPILPHIDQAAVYQLAVEACKIDARTNQVPPHSPGELTIILYTCPGDTRLRETLSTPSGRRVAFTSFIGISGSLIPPRYVSNSKFN